MAKEKQAGIHIAPGRRPWKHELYVAEILAMAGHYVEFLAEGVLPCADIRLDGVEYEIKSPETAKIASVEQLLRKALKQAPNVIIDGSRCKIREDRLCRYLVYKCRNQKQIKHLIFITKSRQIVDITKIAGR